MECNIVLDSTQSMSVKNSTEEVEALSQNLKMLFMFCKYTYIYVTIYSPNPFQGRWFLATILITKTYPVTRLYISTMDVRVINRNYRWQCRLLQLSEQANFNTYILLGVFKCYLQ